MAHTVKYTIPTQNQQQGSTSNTLLEKKQTATRRVLDKTTHDKELGTPQLIQPPLDLPDQFKDSILIALHKDGSAEILTSDTPVVETRTITKIFNDDKADVTSFCTINYVVYDTGGNDPRIVNVGGTILVFP